MHLKVRSQPQELLFRYLHFFKERVSHFLKLHQVSYSNQLMASRSPPILASCLAIPGITRMCHCAQLFYVDSWELNSGPNTHKASAVLEPSSQLETWSLGYLIYCSLIWDGHNLNLSTCPSIIQWETSKMAGCPQGWSLCASVNNL